MQMDTSHSGTNSHRRWSQLHQVSRIWLGGLCNCSLFVSIYARELDCWYYFNILDKDSFYFLSCSGNHERDWPDSGSFYKNMDSGGECGVFAETMFYVPAENRAKFW